MIMEHNYDEGLKDCEVVQVPVGLINEFIEYYEKMELYIRRLVKAYGDNDGINMVDNKTNIVALAMDNQQNIKCLIEYGKKSG